MKKRVAVAILVVGAGFLLAASDAIAQSRVAAPTKPVNGVVQGQRFDNTRISEPFRLPQNSHITENSQVRDHSFSRDLIQIPERDLVSKPMIVPESVFVPEPAITSQTFVFQDLAKMLSVEPLAGNPDVLNAGHFGVSSPSLRAVLAILENGSSENGGSNGGGGSDGPDEPDGSGGSSDGDKNKVPSWGPTPVPPGPGGTPPEWWIGRFCCDPDDDDDDEEANRRLSYFFAERMREIMGWPSDAAGLLVRQTR